MLRVFSDENIVRVYRIFLKITAIGMEEVRKGVVCSTYYYSNRDRPKSKRLCIEMCTTKKDNVRYSRRISLYFLFYHLFFDSLEFFAREDENRHAVEE